MIGKIKSDVQTAIADAFKKALHTNPGNFVAFLVRGDYNSLLEGEGFAGMDPKPSPFCTDYMLDIYNDETRDKFYVRYLNRRYKRDGFQYEGDDGFDDLCVEMMIYSHVWESEKFLKDLYRLSRIISGEKFYDWDVSRVEFHGYQVIKTIKDNLRENCPGLYDIIDKSYAGYIRDSFAHMLYSIDEESRIINLNSDRVKNNLELSRLKYEDFQKRFLYSVELCYELTHMFHDTRTALIEDKELLSKPIELPNGQKMLITTAENFHGEARFRGSIVS